MFKLDHNADANGTSLKGYITLRPRTLIAFFGKPMHGDNYKVSGEYTFTNDQNEVFTIYDWKMTNLYDSDYNLTPDQLWNSDELITFNVGGRTNPAEFIEWIKHDILK